MLRLAASITLRRKHFRYWEKHGKKSSLHPVSRIEPASQQQDEIPKLSPLLDTGKQKRLTSGTEKAQYYHEDLDDRTECETVSHASTALDAEGHCLELPNPPPEALKGKDFVCPYCSVVCPAQCGQGEAWSSVHV